MSHDLYCQMFVNPINILSSTKYDCYKFPPYFKGEYHVAELNAATCLSFPAYFLKNINCIQKTMLFSSPKAASQVLRICKSESCVHVNLHDDRIAHTFPQVCMANDVSYHRSSLLSENCCLTTHLPVAAKEARDTQLQGYGTVAEE